MIRSEKLRNKLIESTHQPPHENLLLIDLPDERWVPFPVAPYDDHYVISNKGRVKRLARITINKKGVSIPLAEKIIKQVVNYNFNRTLNEKSYYLMTKVGMLGCRKSFITARLIYYTFVEPFDLQDPEWYVRHKDGNGLNCLPENLYLFERKKIIHWAIAHDRVKLPPPVSEIWHEEKDSVNYSPMIQPVRVAKYSLTGDLTDIFPSCIAAAKYLGVSETVVRQRISGKLQNKKHILKAIAVNQEPPAKIEVKLPKEKMVIDTRKYGVPEGRIYPFQHISLDDLPGEQWKPIHDTDEVFWVSDLGRVKSIDRMIHTSFHGHYLKTGKIIHPVIKRRGKKASLNVDFTNRKKRVYLLVSHLVYEAFIGQIPKKHAVIHKDKDPFNCIAGNLDICSFSDLKKQYFQERRIAAEREKKHG